MTISISYAAGYGDWSVASYLADWSGFFTGADHGPAASGSGAFNQGVFDGTQYAVKSTESTGSFISGGDLHYTLFSAPAHTLWGALDSVSFGSDLKGGASTGTYTQDQEVSFTQLGLESLKSEGHGGEVHQIIYGLTSGDSTALQGALDALLKAINPSLSVNSTFDDLAAAGVAHVNPAFVASADVGLVGVQDVAQDWALAA